MTAGLTFGDLLRRHRVEAGLTQEALAERAGLSLRGLSDLERGARLFPYRDTVLRVAHALGLDDAQREALLAASRRRRPPGTPSPDVAPSARSASPRHNLPAPLTRFIGRERQIAEIKALIHDARLLTLTGAAGVGKTRLGLQIAGDLLRDFPEGVWQVELAQLADPTLLPQVVATALGLREQPGRPLRQTLADALGSRRLLLMLDNCEHLAAACAELADALLRACPSLRILATSREVLRVAGETVWLVPSLELPPLPLAAPSSPPDPLAPPLLERIERSEAVRLFVARAVDALPGFALTHDSISTVASICHQLDGLPLAIELAAARVSVLGLEQLSARLANRLRLLVRGSHTAPPRQQTLRAILEWSYVQLAEPERRLFERLAVFAGGWTLEAAEVVGAGGGIDSPDVLDLLVELVDKSLVLAEEGPGGEKRYRLLETLRQYGWECLAARGDADETQRRHATYFLALAEDAEPQLWGWEQAAWLQRLGRDHDNLRAALDCMLRADEPATGLRLAGALVQFWRIGGHFTEGRRWLERMLQASTGAHRARLKALHAAADMAYRQGDYAAARALSEQSQALGRKLDDRHGIAISLNTLGNVAWAQGDHAAAQALYSDGLALRRELGDRRGIAISLNNLGYLAIRQGDYALARALFAECLALSRKLGEPRGIAGGLGGLGEVASYEGDYAAARVLLAESLRLRRELGVKRGSAIMLNSLAHVAWAQADHTAARALGEESLALGREMGDQRSSAAALHTLGNVAVAQGDLAAARKLYAEGLAVQHELRDQRGIAECLEGLAGVAALLGDADRAARLFGAAAGLRAEIGAPALPAMQSLYDRHVAAARARLSEESFAVAWATGSARSLDEATTEALHVVGGYVKGRDWA